MCVLSRERQAPRGTARGRQGWSVRTQPRREARAFDIFFFIYRRVWKEREARSHTHTHTHTHRSRGRTRCGLKPEGGLCWKGINRRKSSSTLVGGGWFANVSCVLFFVRRRGNGGNSITHVPSTCWSPFCPFPRLACLLLSARYEHHWGLSFSVHPSPLAFLPPSLHWPPPPPWEQRARRTEGQGGGRPGVATWLLVWLAGHGTARTASRDAGGGGAKK